MSGATEAEGRLTRPQNRLDKHVDTEIESLRERVNDAVRYEEGLKARAGQFEDEAARWDHQADDAVAQGNEASARYAIEQMKRAEQRAVMAQSDLQAHQLATQDLIQRVNMLEAVVADARRSASEQVTAEQTSAAKTPENKPLPDLGNVLREAREKITALGELATAQRDLQPGEKSDSQDEAAVDDDLEQRRQRLSRR
ncbi:MAG: hypothetical protein ABI835_03210 [Chloroflexota bacterium]